MILCLDLGIDVALIKIKTFMVLSFGKSSDIERIFDRPDLAGPLFFTIIFGLFLLFVRIYAFLICNFFRVASQSLDIFMVLLLLDVLEFLCLIC